ncbi:MAG: MSCRAMM family protein [Bacillota bacterium]
MKNYNRIILIVLILLFLSIILYQYPIMADEYPVYGLLTIRSQGEIIGQDEFFELLDMEEYILIPLVSLSRWLEIDLAYNRERQLLTVYYKKEDISILIDFKDEIYFDLPEWSLEPPVFFEGDFYVSAEVIEYLTGARLEWLPARQELILDFDYTKAEEPADDLDEMIIKERPVVPELESEVTGLDFSIGSIQYRIGFDYKFGEGLEEDSLFFNNLLNVHGRIGDWSLSVGQLLEYDFAEEVYTLDYPLLRARNIENNRMIVIGDNRFSLPNTLGRVNLRGISLHYPRQMISTRRAFTSLRGEAEEGSRVYLYADDRKVGEKYIYKGEDEYHFENVPLSVGRTNIFRVVIEGADGQEREIVKKVAGSLHIFEEGTREGFFAAGRYNSSDAADSLLEVGGVQVKFAPTAGTSIFWELGAERVFDDSVYQGFEAGSVVRIALRPEDIPLVFMAEWLTGSEVSLVEHGARVSTLYTREDGSIKASLSYVPPVVGNNVNVETGQQFLVNLQQELNENWLGEVEVENLRSILNMETFDLSRVRLTFDYRDRARNSLIIASELARRNENIEWEELDLIEEGRSWLEINLQGRSFRGPTRLGGEIIYVLSDINFQDNIDGIEDSRREDHVEIEFKVSSNIRDGLILSGGVNSSFTWLEGSNLDSESLINLRANLKTGDNTYFTAGITSQLGYKLEEENNRFTEDARVLELSVRHNVPRDLTITAGIKNTYLQEESYFSGKTGFVYQNQENDWSVGLDYEYIAPYSKREIPQHIASLEYNRHLFSGLEGSFNLKRAYPSRGSDNSYYEASISLSQVLGFARDNVTGQKYQRGEHSSYIAGLVYLDLDGTGRRDPGDPLLEDISISRDGLRTRTDKDGYFIFENVRNGLYEVGFNLRELPDVYRVITEDKIVQVRENENIFLEYGLTRLGALGGRALIAKNDSGERDGEEVPLSRLGLRIEELNRTIFTRGDGTFAVDDLPLGQYTVRVMESSLPEGLTVSGEGIYEVEISPEQPLVQNIEIILE